MSFPLSERGLLGGLCRCIRWPAEIMVASLICFSLFPHRRGDAQRAVPPAVHQMVQMQRRYGTSPRGGWCRRKAGSRTGPLPGFCCSLPLLGLKVFDRVETRGEKRREEESRAFLSYICPGTTNARWFLANDLPRAGALHS